jgi:hypothetical protein
MDASLENDAGGFEKAASSQQWPSVNRFGEVNEIWRCAAS